ncbi:glycosyltransferase [Methanosphaera sp. Vir-13MRS]|uniref:glycosyltransferase n=1 Tax=Candidatus Methanosphaera massiliense TaxID=3017187 RepID=UPI0023800AD1|nr:glycosyltransferase [Candidatus Methanosphaera massiliense]MDE4078780.1 glycosyltransferase [Candidatus Methanosphaera massiliense]
MVKISVIMPVYNEEQYLEKTCQSLKQQTLDDIELICINDGSTDNSTDILTNLATEYDNIRIINQENQGSGIARNKGIDEAKGEYIAFLDADDKYIDPYSLKKMYEYGYKNNADIICGNLKRISSEGKLEDNFNYVEGNYAYFPEYDKLTPQDYGIPWAFYKNIYRKKFLDENNIRFPDLKRGQDPVFLADVLTKADVIYTVPVYLYGYNYSASGGANSKVNSHDKKLDYLEHFKETFRILEDNGFYNISQKYKERLILYLQLQNNRTDKELIQLVHEVFEDDDPQYFNNIEDEVLYLQIYLINNTNPIAYKTSIADVKEQLYMKVTTDNVNYDIMKKYLEIMDKNYEDNEIIVEKLKEENDNTKNSSSWKTTGFIRSIEKIAFKGKNKCKRMLVSIW